MRLVALFKSPRFGGSRRAFMDQTGLSKGRFSQLFDPRESFGEAAAQQLARRLGLPDRYFELTALSAFAMEVASRLDAMMADEPRFLAAYNRLTTELDRLEADACAPTAARHAAPTPRPVRGT